MKAWLSFDIVAVFGSFIFRVISCSPWEIIQTRTHILQTDNICIKRQKDTLCKPLITLVLMYEGGM